MIKAAKKLRKLWPRKKKRKKTYQEPYYFLPPPSCHCCCSYSTPVQPSAPPLPPWLESAQTHEAISSTEVQQLPEEGYQSQFQFPSQEIVVETDTNAIYPTLPNTDTPLTYQQYAVPNPVYGVPVVEQTPRRERSAGFFGCFVKFGANLIRCFCPCFHIREV
ncbi:uncharacterized protein LOC8262569 [Ricinus communis]|uniref:Uncharacterized protein n=1 Tax=Ricinus communis TaxID=3988 RepID=B9SPB8_RICCO|nr:uncharacterized protein LOC8262569 [Ricinus communis]XP_048231752.1 uncharacterized protein LOC8262569 [Ricinus communis]EEF34540.1 conserved hypothetical protein [Ricinus communis]|eukprot:XP_002527837.1 uncharacterized protein LOC8262569 [Ricinus communis]